MLRSFPSFYSFLSCYAPFSGAPYSDAYCKAHCNPLYNVSYLLRNPTVNSGRMPLFLFDFFFSISTAHISSWNWGQEGAHICDSSSPYDVITMEHFNMVLSPFPTTACILLSQMGPPRPCSPYLLCRAPVRFYITLLKNAPIYEVHYGAHNNTRTRELFQHTRTIDPLQAPAKKKPSCSGVQ